LPAGTSEGSCMLSFLMAESYGFPHGLGMEAIVPVAGSPTATGRES